MIKNMSAAPDEVAHMAHRDYTTKFAEVMARQLTDHRQIGNWATYRPGKIQLITELNACMAKLKKAIDTDTGVREKSADLANFCAKAAEMFGTQPPAARPEPVNEGPITPSRRTAREWADVKGILIRDNDGGFRHGQLYSETEFDDRAARCTTQRIKK